MVEYFPTNKNMLSALQRAALSHLLRTTERKDEVLQITTEWMKKFVHDARLPNMAEQATKLIRLIGDHIAETGEGYYIKPTLDTARVGTIGRKMLYLLRDELLQKQLVKSMGMSGVQNETDGEKVTAETYGLTLEGWEKYESERHGHFSGKYGFIAMKFGDSVMDAFVEKFLKPIVKNAINFEVVDLRNVARAGIIDNIMRAQIRDAAFVLVDLTHDNHGAYWEAGYAEGLGKPVVYLCERGKFDHAKTHFDTNHCTTVLWEASKPEEFGKELVATLRRSLNLFPPVSAS